MKQKRITIRFSEYEEALYKMLVESAKKNRRSLNAEMLRAFEYYLKRMAEQERVSK